MLQAGLYREIEELKQETKQPIRGKSAVVTSHMIGRGEWKQKEGTIPWNSYKVSK
jgi:hypothetical protein